jgi:hypothetical protein
VFFAFNLQTIYQHYLKNYQNFKKEHFLLSYYLMSMITKILGWEPQERYCQAFSGDCHQKAAILATIGVAR